MQDAEPLCALADAAMTLTRRWRGCVRKPGSDAQADMLEWVGVFFDSAAALYAALGRVTTAPMAAFACVVRIRNNADALLAPRGLAWDGEGVAATRAASEFESWQAPERDDDELIDAIEADALALFEMAPTMRPAAADWIRTTQADVCRFSLIEPRGGYLAQEYGRGRLEFKRTPGQACKVRFVDPAEHEQFRAFMAARPRRKPRGRRGPNRDKPR